MTPLKSRWSVIVLLLFGCWAHHSQAAPAAKTQKAAKAPKAPKVATLPSWPKAGGKVLRLRQLRKLALANNPTLRRLRRSVQVMKQREKRAGPWPDLKVGVSATNFPLDTFNPTTTGMSGIIYSVSQKFPILGRLSLKKEIARRDTEMLKALVKERANRIVFGVYRAVYALGYLRKALEIEKELYQLTGQAAAVARTRYTAGKAPQQHYLQALTRQSISRSQMATLVTKARIWQQTLRRLVGAPSHKALGRLPQQAAILPLLTAKQAAKAANKERGALERWRVAIRQAKELLSLAKVRYWPDVTVKLSVRQRFPNPMDDGAPFLSLGVSVPIPSWGNSARAGLAKEAMARHQQAHSRIKELRRLYQEQARIALLQIKLQKRQIEILTQQTIPLSMQTYRAALGQYQVDKIDFLTLLSNLRTLFQQKRQLAKLRRQQAEWLAKLHAIAGTLLSK